ncbi:MAG: radical SAM protein [Gammaproteobacteria bacterium]|nr:radical SAM protein [Gammaproteobacteria bacterium]
MGKLLFLEVNTEPHWALASVGPAFIASYLRENGHEAVFHNIPFDSAFSKTLENIERENPDLIGISITSRQWQAASQLAIEIKKHLAIPIIAGGLHASFCSEEILASPGFDFACIGEGEQATLELMNALSNNDLDQPIKNIRAKHQAMPTLRPAIPDLDNLPFMARDMLGEQYGVYHISTQRGCPFPCTYCAAQQVSQLYPDGYKDYGRRRSVSNVLQEIKSLRQNGPLNYIIFLDDTFTLHHDWLIEFLKRYQHEIKIPFSVNARAETISRNLLQHLADAGCMHIIYGVESGSEQVRKNILSRNISNQHLRDAFQWTRDLNILVTANYMLGLPGEKPEDIEQTLNLHTQLKPDDFGYFVFYPFPGTALYSLCKEKGYLPDNYLELPANHHESILNLPDLSKSDISYYYNRFTELQIHDRLARSAMNATQTQREDLIADIKQTAEKA